MIENETQSTSATFFDTHVKVQECSPTTNSTTFDLNITTMQRAPKPDEYTTDTTPENFKNTIHCTKTNSRCASMQCSRMRTTSQAETSLLRSKCKTDLHPFARRKKRERKALPDLNDDEQFHNIIGNTQSSGTDISAQLHHLISKQESDDDDDLIPFRPRLLRQGTSRNISRCVTITSASE